MPTSYNAVQFGSYVYATQSAHVSRWRDEGLIRPALTPIPRSVVARASAGRLGPRLVGIEGVIANSAWSAQSDLRTAVDAFLAAHLPGGYGTLYRDSDRTLAAEVRRVTVGDRDGLLRVPFSVAFECADPYYYDTTPTSDTWSNPADNDTHVVANSGSAPAAPVFTITIGAGGAAAVTLTLTNQTANPDEAFTLVSVGNVVEGDVLAVDCAQHTVTFTHSGTEANKRSWLTGDFPSLLPGNNTLALALSGGPTLASIVTAFSPRYY